MMRRLAMAILVVILLGTGTAFALGSAGHARHTRAVAANAAVTEYVPVTPTTQTTPPPPVGGAEGGVKGVSGTAGGRSGRGGQRVHGAAGGGEPSGGAVKGVAARSRPPVETAATGPVGTATGLPFTGLDLGLLAAVGALLLLLGLVPRRLGARDDRR